MFDHEEPIEYGVTLGDELKRRERRKHQRDVLRAVAITLSVLVAGAYLVVMPVLAWISSGFGLAVSGYLPPMSYLRSRP